MAFIGGERLFSVPAAVLAAVIGAGVVAVASEPRGVSLESLAGVHELTATRDASTGVVTLRGAAGVVRLAPGLAMASVNGRRIEMDEAAYVRSGKVYVSGAFAARLSTLMAPAPTPPPPADAVPAVPAGPAPADADADPPTAAALPAGPTWRVVIDAGHGGKFDGTVGPTGLKEKDLTLLLAEKLAQRLEALGIEVVETRRSDLSLSENWSEDLDLRVAVGEAADPDLFLSLHFNSEPSGTVQGFEVHLPRAEGGGPKDRTIARVQLDAARDAGLRAARLIRDELRDVLETADRGLKFGRNRVVYRTAVPAVLVEYAFISNADSEQRYRDPGALDVLADATARAVRRHLAGVRPRVR